MIRESIQDFLKKNNIPREAGFIIAVSGGADSIALLHAFRFLNLKIAALHCNFHLRGEESDRDEQFVRHFCDNYGIEVSVQHFDTKSYAREKGISIEMAARELRYTWFQEMKQKKQMDYIVTGHQADDVAETLFINLCRGTGIKGVGGIKPVNGDILRPLLPCSREEILLYLKNNQLDFRNDSSNESLDFMRNIIRHKIIPVCKEINPSFLNTLRENCKAFREAGALYAYSIEQLRKEVVEYKTDEILIHISKTMETPAPNALLFELLQPYGFNKHQVSDILNSHLASPGKIFESKDYILTRGRTYWRIFKHKKQYGIPLCIEKAGTYQIGEQRIRFELMPRTALSSIPTAPYIACLDAGKIKFPLHIRHWEKGDKFCPLGMHQLKKKVSDFFNDQKFSAKQKEECLLLLSENKIAWVIGYRTDERFKITPLTETVLQITRSQ
ncbi:MAG: tRNA lysidine(34) synthetase TilS [Odoribacter sp.]|nr:tRNA lysidine(34) synthetase TilS [Odoribacter sp.]